MAPAPLDHNGRPDLISTQTAITPRLPSDIAGAIGSRLDDRERRMSPFAKRSVSSRGRATPEPPSPMRSEFQRDRDRILHTKAFRRLKHKTQVFIAPLGDHYATRLTHTLEVAQIARTIARALDLNEDLTEAIALGHDLGHTPFGHVGEEELDDLYPGGFRHSQQSLRIVEQLEKEGRGLNLTWEVRQGILRHSKPRGEFLDAESVEGLSLEAQICRISDAVAYLNHDLADAFRAGALTQDRLPSEVAEALGATHAERIDTLVSDIIAASWPASGHHQLEAGHVKGAFSGATPVISMGDEVKGAFYTLREFMFDAVYIPTDRSSQGQTARAIMRLLYSHFDNNRHQIPAEYGHRSRSEDEAVVDFISGMTDHYALRVAESIEPGITLPFTSQLKAGHVKHQLKAGHVNHQLKAGHVKH